MQGIGRRVRRCYVWFGLEHKKTLETPRPDPPLIIFHYTLDSRRTPQENVIVHGPAIRQPPDKPFGGGQPETAVPAFDNRVNGHGAFPPLWQMKINLPEYNFPAFIFNQ